MANQLRGEASFLNDGETLTIVFDAEAFLQVEDAVGIGLFRLVGEGLSSLKVLAELLIAGLARGGGPVLTREEAATIVLMNDQASPAVIAALERALPQKKEDAENPPQAVRKVGTGKKS